MVDHGDDYGTHFSLVSAVLTQRLSTCNLSSNPDLMPSILSSMQILAEAPTFDIQFRPKQEKSSACAASFGRDMSCAMLMVRERER